MWSASTYPDGESADMQRLGLWTAHRLAEATALARESGDGPALLALLERTVRSLRITLDLASGRVGRPTRGSSSPGASTTSARCRRFEC